MKDKTTANLTNFKPSGELGEMFEKARIMGARALQLSLGAPVFIEIPKNATTSLEIAMEELKQRMIPIVIKRTLPNGDYQNIPLDKFE